MQADAREADRDEQGRRGGDGEEGVQPRDAGGTGEVKGRVEGADVAISVANPVAVGERRTSREGNRLALENIRQRLRLAYGHRGRVEVEEQPDRYEVTLIFPYEE